MSSYEDIWYESSDGLKLYARAYACRGERSLGTVLCMHGLTRNSADFADLAQHLSDHYRVIAVDQRGRGMSAYDSNPLSYALPTYIADMQCLVEDQQLESLILVGTSMGGLMSFMLGAIAPKLIRGMIINDVGPEVSPVGLRRLQAYVGKLAPVENWEQAIAQAKAINKIAFPDYSEAQWEQFTRGIYRERDGLPVLAYDPAIAQPMATDSSDAVAPDLWPLFGALADIPMLLLRGESSDILEPYCVAKMREYKPGLKVTEIPNRGHAPDLNEPASLAAIDDFLATLD